MASTLFRFRTLVIGAAIAASCTSAEAFFGTEIVYDPTHTAQSIAQGAMRAAEAARQLQVEINQYQQMVRDGLALTDPVFRPFGDTIRSLYSLHMTGRSLMYQAENLDTMFGTMYPSYYSYMGTMGAGRSMSETMRDRYRTWSDNGYQNTRNALQSAGIRVNRMDSEQAMLEQLVEQSNRAGGHMQAMQAANQIAANQTQQMQDLRLLVIENTSLHANYYAQQIEQRTFDDAFRTQFRSAPVIDSPSRGF